MPEFRLRDPGEGIHEAEILEIHVSEGDAVEEGDVVLTVETDKAAIELPSPMAGTVERIEVSVGDVARVGDILMVFSGDGEAEAGRPPPEEEAPEERLPPEPAADGERREGRPVPASPATRRLARELGVDLRSVEGSGPGGRVVREDVEAAAEEAPARAPRPPRPQAVELPDFERWGPVERVPLRSIRRTIAQHMELSWSQIPHVTHQDVADITELEAFRRRQKERLDGVLSLTILAMKAAVAALKEFPRFNASLDGEAGEIVLKRHYHVGVAVDTEQGLLVPVIRDVDGKSLAELAAELPELVDRVRSGEARLEDLQGGTFTITNPGPIGGTAFTPIINYPEVAILGLARARLEPVMAGDVDEHRMVPRLRLPLCLAFDHRVNDGADAARFVRRIVQILESPEDLLLHG